MALMADHINLTDTHTRRRTMKIYLDYQILDDLHKGELDEVANKITALKRAGHRFPYSPAHCEEIAVPVIQYNNLKKLKLIRYLRNISDSIGLLPFRRNDAEIIESPGVFVSRQDPSRCYYRVVLEYDRNAFAERVSEERLALAELSQDRLPSVTQNNLSPEEVLPTPTLNEILGATYVSLRFPDLPPPVTFGNVYTTISGDFRTTEDFIERLFNRVEDIGFNPEPISKSRSRLHDVSHGIYGSYCDVLVTRDSRFRKKCDAVYRAMGTSCKVVDLPAFMAL